VPVEVREFTFGMSATAGLLVLADVARRLLRHRGQERGRALYPLPGAVAAMLVAGAAIGIWKLRS
jgi:hypothetical protein